MKKLLVSLILLAGVFISYGCRSNKESFNMGYENLKDKEHVFKEVEYNEVKSLFEGKKDFYLFLAFPSCPWCKEYISYVNEVAKTNDITEVYYMNIREFRNYEVDWENLTYSLEKKYEELINYIGDSHLTEKVIYNDTDESKFVSVPNWIYAPTLLSVKEGVVLRAYETVPGHERDQGVLPPLTSEQKAFLIEAYNELFQSIK